MDGIGDEGARPVPTIRVCDSNRRAALVARPDAVLHRPDRIGPVMMREYASKATGNPATHQADK